MKYRNKQTNEEYYDVQFTGGNTVYVRRSPVGAWITLTRDDIEEVQPVAQISLATNETEADKRFREFDEKNPHVYRQLVKMTRDLKAQGHKKIGMQMLFEVIRWRSMMKTTDADFKMNNNYAGRYARKVMSENSDLDGMFELRTLKS